MTDDGDDRPDPDALLERVTAKQARTSREEALGDRRVELHIPPELLAEAHGGTVTAETPPDRGARFRITLPADPEIPGIERPTGDALAALPVREAAP
jgi:hypothetical protein